MLVIKGFLQDTYNLIVDTNPECWQPTDEDLFDEILKMHAKIMAGFKTLAAINNALGTNMKIDDFK